MNIYIYQSLQVSGDYGLSVMQGAPCITDNHPHRIKNLTFIGLYIVIYFYSKTNEMHQFL